MKSQVTGEEIRGYDKDMLLDFYEKRIKFVKSGTRVKQENIQVEEQQQLQYQKTLVSKGQIEEEFERSRENEKKSENKQQGDNSNKGSVRKLFEKGTAQKEVLEPGKRVKVIGSVGKRSEATTRFDEDGFLSDYGTPARFKESIEQEITSYQIERDS